MNRRSYPTDVSDAEWEIIRPLLPEAHIRGRPWQYDLREIYNAIRYIVRSGCAWRLLPHDFPKWRTVYNHFAEWRDDGVFERISQKLAGDCRKQVGRNPAPSLAIIDSASVKMVDQTGERGYDGNKKANGRKRFIVTDVLGLVMAVAVCAADVSEQAGGVRVLKEFQGTPAWTGRLEVVLADMGFRGSPVVWCAANGIRMDISNKLPGSSTFKVVRQRWVVERTFAWLNKHRRLSKDYEVLPRTEEAMVHQAMTSLMLRRLSRVA
jgi:putative transposase